MPNYRRAFEGGRTWFFTVNLLDRRKRQLVEHIGALREAVRETRERFRFEIDAWVVLPDHLHAVWTLPEGDCDFPVRWYLIKMRSRRPFQAARRGTRSGGCAASAVSGSAVTGST